MLVCFLIFFFSPLFLHLYFPTMFFSAHQNTESPLKITNFFFFCKLDTDFVTVSQALFSQTALSFPLHHFGCLYIWVKG